MRGIYQSPVHSPKKGQWRGALMFSLTCSWTNGWANIRGVGAGDAIALIMMSLECFNDTSWGLSYWWGVAKPAWYWGMDKKLHPHKITVCKYFPMPQLQWQFNTLRPRQNGRRFTENVFKRMFLNENVWISLKISLQFVSKGPINNIPALVQIMAWRRPGDKPLSEPMVVSLPTHICVARPRWVN